MKFHGKLARCQNISVGGMGVVQGHAERLAHGSQLFICRAGKLALFRSAFYQLENVDELAGKIVLDLVAVPGHELDDEA